MPGSDELDARPVRAFVPHPETEADERRWPASVPAVAQLLRGGLEIPAGVTGLVGENGSGKSTVVAGPAALVVLPARRHHEPALHLPGGVCRPA